jgi:hypothetical protein
MDLRKIECEVEDYIELAEARVHWYDFVNALIEL